MRDDTRQDETDGTTSHLTGGLAEACVKSKQVEATFFPSRYGPFRGNNFMWMREEAPPLQAFYQRLYREADFYIAHRYDASNSVTGIAETSRNVRLPNFTHSERFSLLDRTRCAAASSRCCSIAD